MQPLTVQRNGISYCVWSYKYFHSYENGENLNGPTGPSTYICLAFEQLIFMIFLFVLKFLFNSNSTSQCARRCAVFHCTVVQKPNFMDVLNIIQWVIFLHKNTTISSLVTREQINKYIKPIQVYCKTLIRVLI